MYSAKVDLTPWLHQLHAELDASLADLAQTMRAVEEGTYSQMAQGVRFGLIRINFEPQVSGGEQVIQQATKRCFRASIASFIGFLDKLIASDLVIKDGISIDRNLSGDKQIADYVVGYIERKISEIASDRALTNPKKIAHFSSLSDDLKNAALGYFALRRCLEHHQGIAQEEITLHLLRQKLFVDDTEVTVIPFTVDKGQALKLKLIWEKKVFAEGSRVSLAPEDAYAISATIRVAVAPEIFKSRVQSG